MRVAVIVSMQFNTNCSGGKGGDHEFVARIGRGRVLYIHNPCGGCTVPKAAEAKVFGLVGLGADLVSERGFTGERRIR